MCKLEGVLHGAGPIRTRICPLFYPSDSNLPTRISLDPIRFHSPVPFATMLPNPLASPAAPPGAAAPDYGPRHRVVPAWLMSVLTHAVLLTVLGIAVQRPQQGTGQASDRPVGIAIAHPLPDRTRYDVAPPADEQSTAGQETSAADAAAAAAPPAGFEAPLDLAGVLAELTATPMPVSGSGSAGDATAPSEAPRTGRMDLGDGGSQPATTMLFGISGSGSRFVYVFDRSDSMNGFGGRPLLAAKRELINSLRGLGEQQQFQIIFYNDRSTLFTPGGQPPGMLTGDQRTRARAEGYVRNMPAVGGTQHMDALKMALRLDPDVIFFLTDATLPRPSRRQLNDIASRSLHSGTSIHAVEFGAGPSAPPDSFMRVLAAQNGGQYRYLDVRQFSPAGEWLARSQESP